MILSYVLFILFIILLAILICFFVYILSPKKEKSRIFKDSDLVISDDEMNYITPDVPLTKISNKRAFVFCSPNKEFKVDCSIFNKKHTCFMINSDNGTGTDCKFSCIGLGDCVNVCPQEAIKIINNTAVVTSLCIGCGKCVDICPLHIIKLIPVDTKKICICSNCNKDPTSCSKLEIEDNVSWKDKKDFKIWYFCYKILKRLFTN